MRLNMSLGDRKRGLSVGELIVAAGQMLDARDYVSGSSWAFKYGGLSAATVADTTKSGDFADLAGSTSQVTFPTGAAATFTPTTGAFSVVSYCSFDVINTGSVQKIFSTESASDNGLWLGQNFDSSQIRARVGGATTAITRVGPSTVTAGQKVLASAVIEPGVGLRCGTGASLSVALAHSGVGTITHAASNRVGQTAAASGFFRMNGKVGFLAVLPGVVLTTSDLTAINAWAVSVWGS